LDERLLSQGTVNLSEPTEKAWAGIKVSASNGKTLNQWVDEGLNERKTQMFSCQILLDEQGTFNGVSARRVETVGQIRSDYSKVQCIEISLSEEIIFTALEVMRYKHFSQIIITYLFLQLDLPIKLIISVTY